MGIRHGLAAVLLLSGCLDVGKGPEGASDPEDDQPDPSAQKVVGAIAYGQTLTMTYVNPPKYHSYSFSGGAGDEIDVRVRSTDGDPMVRILDSSSRVLVANDDADGTLNSHATVTLTTAGTHYVSVREYSLRRAAFTITLVGVRACQKKTCQGEHAECGTIDDGCGGTLDCGACDSPDSCGGGGVPYVCGCTPTTCADQGAECGAIDDGCGGTVACATCPAGETCGPDNTCGTTCTPRTCADAGANCGSVADGCGGSLSCGTCQAPATCGGGGVPNQCGVSGDPYAGLSDGALKTKIFEVESTGHHGLGYTRAREELFKRGGVSDDAGMIECIYTGVRKAPVASGPPAGFNTEHTWPQSLGADSEPKKSDLHHLQPSTETANSARGSYYFGMTSCGEAGEAACRWEAGGSQAGTLTSGSTIVFEVRPSRRGDAARIWFYFATRYRMAIPDWTESILKDWHNADPVDAWERGRNDRVQALQGNRNVFIDRPDLVARIRDF